MSRQWYIKSVAYQQGIDESKIDGLSLRLSFYTF
jgi:hypothetical protein